MKFRIKFAGFANFWRRNSENIKQLTDNDDIEFDHRISPEPFAKDEIIFKTLHSFPRMEDLMRAILQVQETGIMNFYRDGFNFPSWVNTNPYKWSNTIFEY